MYIAFRRFTYSTITPFSITKYFLYTSGSVLAISSSSFNLIIMFITESCSIVNKFIGTSTISTYLPSSVFLAGVRSTALIDTVGDVASSLDNPGLCFWPSSQPCSLTLPSRFYSRNIIDSRASYLPVSVISPAVIGLNVLFMWCWSKYLDMDYCTFDLNCLSPIFRYNCVIALFITEAKQ